LRLKLSFTVLFYYCQRSDHAGEQVKMTGRPWERNTSAALTKAIVILGIPARSSSWLQVPDLVLLFGSYFPSPETKNPKHLLPVKHYALSDARKCKLSPKDDNKRGTIVLGNPEWAFFFE